MSALIERLRERQSHLASVVEVSPAHYEQVINDLTEAGWTIDPANVYACLAAHDRLMDERRPYKRHNGCLISADYRTPANDQRFGYVLEPRA